MRHQQGMDNATDDAGKDCAISLFVPVLPSRVEVVVGAGGGGGGGGVEGGQRVGGRW